MTPLFEYQAALGAAVRGGDRARALALFEGPPARRERGFKVYANNAMHALVSALNDTFPAVRRIVGETEFTTVAVAYVRQHPPARDGLLIWYGARFPRFLDSLKMACAPDLADLARLEFAWLEAYHAAEAEPLTVSHFATLAPDQLVAARLTLHPSVRLLRSSCAVDAIWNAARDDLADDLGPKGEKDRCLVVARPLADVLVLPVSSPVFDCLADLRDGKAFGDATRHLDPAEAAAELQALIAAGLFTHIAMES